MSSTPRLIWIHASNKKLNNLKRAHKCVVDAAKIMTSNLESETKPQQRNPAKKKKITFCDANDSNFYEKISIDNEISNYLNLSINVSENSCQLEF